eukprot:s1895_g5.t1
MTGWGFKHLCGSETSRWSPELKQLVPFLHSTAMDAPASKRRRYSLECDVEIEVADGECVQTHSHVLMAASDVFAAMLGADMQEARTGRIVLGDKTKGQLEEFLQHLDLRGGAGPPPVTDQNVELLVQFADEYQVIGLRDRCISFLKAQPETKICDSLEFACKHNLQEVIELCVQTLVKKTQNDFLRIQEATTYGEVERIDTEMRHTENILQGLESHTTVRRAVHRELLEIFGESKFVKLDFSESWEHWKVLVNFLLETKKIPQRAQQLKYAMSTEWMVAFKKLVVMAITEYEKRNAGEEEDEKEDEEEEYG